MKINIKKLRETAKIPTRGSDSAAGYDLYADMEKIALYAHQTLKIETGIAIEIPEGYFGAIFARSGLATKQGLGLATAVSIIDSDYRGELIVPIYNNSDINRLIMNHDRIAQLVILPYLPVEFNEVSELSTTERGEGGFGHTGKD